MRSVASARPDGHDKSKLYNKVKHLQDYKEGIEIVGSFYNRTLCMVIPCAQILTGESRLICGDHFFDGSVLCRKDI